METLKRAVRWAVQDGVRELSVYSDLGKSPVVLPRAPYMSYDWHTDESGWEGIPQELQTLTMKDSSSSSRTSSTKSSPPRTSTPPDSLSSASLLEDGAQRLDTGNESEASESSSPTPTRSNLRGRKVLKKAPKSPTTTLVLGDSRMPLSRSLIKEEDRG